MIKLLEFAIFKLTNMNSFRQKNIKYTKEAKKWKKY